MTASRYTPEDKAKLAERLADDLLARMFVDGARSVNTQVLARDRRTHAILSEIAEDYRKAAAQDEARRMQDV